MSKVIIVGDIYYADLYPDQGLPGGGQGGRPSHPIHYPGAPSHPIHYPGAPSQPIYHPGHPDHGYVPHPDQGLPGGQGGRPSQPIYHPGHPDHGLPPYPDQGLPPGQAGTPEHPIALPPGGEVIPPEEITPPELPPDYQDDLVIAVHKPGGEWTFTAYDVAPSQGQPAPTPHK